jgi:cytochrome c553
MNTVAKDMTDAELTAIAGHVAGLPPPPVPAGPRDDVRYSRGAKLAEQRICGTCHNPDYSGREQIPRIANQRQSYLVKALNDYRIGKRIGTQAAMAEAVRGLDDAAIADLAYFLSHFRP